MTEQPNAELRVLICGATGYLGRHLVRSAHERGHYVRALARDANRLAEVRPLCDDVFVGQATVPSTLAGLCDEIDVVVSSLGNRTMRRKPTIWEVDEQANMNILEVACEASVKQFVFVSLLRGDELRGRIPQAEARERVVDALRDSGLEWTVERPSGFFNDMAEFFKMAQHRGTVWLFGCGDISHNPIHGTDLAEVIMDHVGNPEAYGQAYPVGGPDVLTQRRIAELAFEALGKEPRIRSVPLWLVGAAATVIKPFNINLGSLLAMLHAMARVDATTDTYGTHHLAHFYRELAVELG